MVPSPTTLTRKPVFPSILYCIVSSTQPFANLPPPPSPKLIFLFSTNSCTICNSRQSRIVSPESMSLTERRHLVIVQAFVLIVFVLFSAAPASAQVDRLLQGLGGKEKQGGLRDAKIGSGLK